MAKAEKKDPQAGDATEKGEDKPKSNRTSFKDLWPEDAALKCLVEENPKKAGSKSAARFEHYFKAATVGDFLAAGGTYADIAYDLPRKRIQVG